MGGEADPLVTAPRGDEGSDTTHRFWYQAGYAAWLALRAINGSVGAVAVYCEHHEDVLLELEDSRCDAIQVKSQDDGIAPLRATDEAVLKSLHRFAVLEHQFGSRFRLYHLACIAGFYSDKRNGSNLKHCLKQAADCHSGSLPERPLSGLIKRINVPEDVTQDTVLAALRKVRLNESLPKLQDMETRVREAIEDLDDVGSYRSGDLVDAARAVIQRAFDAGKSTEANSSAEYVAYLEDPKGHAAGEAIRAKRLDLDEVREIIRGAADRAALLKSKDGSNASRLPATSAVALRKLDAGGVNVHTVGVLDDLRSSAEFEIANRLYRDEAKAVDAEYDHLSVLVATLAEDARLQVSGDESGRYGPAMYQELRKRLRKQCEAQPQSVRGFTPEQLTGIAMMLTEQCRVWWSEPFALEGLDE